MYCFILSKMNEFYTSVIPKFCSFYFLFLFYFEALKYVANLMFFVILGSVSFKSEGKMLTPLF